MHNVQNCRGHTENRNIPAEFSLLNVFHRHVIISRFFKYMHESPRFFFFLNPQNQFVNESQKKIASFTNFEKFLNGRLKNH